MNHGAQGSGVRTTGRGNAAPGHAMRWSLAALALVLVAVTGCADDNTGAGDARSERQGVEQSTTTKAGGSGAGGAASAGTASGPNAWQKVIAPANCQCSDGSGYQFWIHRGTSDRVLFYLEGGGACFSADTCGPVKPSFTRNLTGRSGEYPSEGERPPGGILDLENARNPFRDDSIVYVPYCTGDLHTGNAVHDYGDGVVIRHNGYTNASTALAATAAMFPSAAEVVVAGGSAGSAGSPLYAGLAHDVFPDAAITLIADGSGAYPGTEAITTAVGALWGRSSAIPPWPESAGQPVSAWSLPGTFVQAGKHDPEMNIGTINTAYDETQARFVSLVGFPGDDLLAMIDENNRFIEDAGVAVQSWVGPGTLHTILTRPEFYSAEVEGTDLVGWVSDLIDGTAPDVHCDDCR